MVDKNPFFARGLMFYRACESYTTGNHYHCLSAISSDGINFTRETVHILKSNLIYRTATSNGWHILLSIRTLLILCALYSTGADTNMTSGPDRLYTAVSFDEGLTWSNFTPLFNNGHDPVLVKDGSGLYHLYFSYLNTGFRKATSNDGVTWTSPANSVYFKQGSVFLTESSSPNSIADLGSYTNSAGDVILFSAYKTGMGPWTNIAYYSKQTSSIQENFEKSNILIYPNPFSESVTIQTSAFLNNATITLNNSLGKTVQKAEQITGHTATLYRQGLPSGGVTSYILERVTKAFLHKRLLFFD